jgi:hypothetical protein
MKTKFLFTMIAMAAMTFAGCSKDDDAPASVLPPGDYEVDDAPPYAASNYVWVFGDQIWSDVIQMPDCNKETFENSNTAPQGRSYTSGERTFYYYNWAYVNANKNTLCPSSWRVPNLDDLEILESNINASKLINAWGYSGYVDGSSIDRVGTDASYWSSTETNSDRARYLYYHSGGLSLNLSSKYFGFPVRCVRYN